MDKLKLYGKAFWAILEKPLLVLVGLGLIAVSVLKFDEQSTRIITLAFGTTAFTFGIAPMFWAFAKDNWPKGKK